LTCLFPATRLRDPKVRLFTDFITSRMRADLAAAVAGLVV
jgi:hypothetical protein